MILALCLSLAPGSLVAWPSFTENSAHIDNPYLRMDLLQPVHPFEGWGPQAQGQVRFVLDSGIEVLNIVDHSTDPPVSSYVSCRMLTLMGPIWENAWTLWLAQDEEGDVYCLMLEMDLDQDGVTQTIQYPTQDSPGHLPLYMPAAVEQAGILCHFWAGLSRQVVSVEQDPLTLATGWGGQDLRDNVLVSTLLETGDQSSLILNEIYHMSTDTSPGGLIRVCDLGKENGYDRTDPLFSTQQNPLIQEPIDPLSETPTPTLTATPAPVAITTPTCTPIPQDPSEEAWLKALECMEQGDYEGASFHLKLVLRHHTNDILALKAYQMKIIAHGKLGDLTGALSPAMAIVFHYLKKPVDPARWECWPAWQKLLEMKPWECATVAEEILLAHIEDPENAMEARVLAALGHICATWPQCNRERADHAVRHLEEGLPLTQDPSWIGYMKYMLGTLHCFRGEIDQGETILDEMREIEDFIPVEFVGELLAPRLPHGQDLVEVLCAEGGLVFMLHEYVNAWRHYLISQHLHQAGDRAGQKQRLIQASNLSWVLRLEARLLAEILRASRSLSEPLEDNLAVIVQEIHREPNTHLGDEAMNLLVRDAQQQNNPKQVVAVLEGSVSQETPDEIRAYVLYVQGNIWESCGNTDAGLENYASLLNEYSDTRAAERARLAKAAIHRQRQEIAEMLAEYRAVVADITTYDDAYLSRKLAAKAIGDYYLETEQAAKAAAWWKHLKDPSCPDPTQLP